MLLDTSGLLCLLHRAELQHQRAVSLYRTTPRRLTHSYILAELVALAGARKLPRLEVLEFLKHLDQDRSIETVWVDRGLHATAFELLEGRLDKTYSLCDAVSFVLMRRSGIRQALTTDHHFDQEGFVRLLK